MKISWVIFLFDFKDCGIYNKEKDLIKSIAEHIFNEYDDRMLLTII